MTIQKKKKKKEAMNKDFSGMKKMSSYYSMNRTGKKCVINPGASRAGQ
jgi:hypothetical protein